MGAPNKSKDFIGCTYWVGIGMVEKGGGAGQRRRGVRLLVGSNGVGEV